MARSHGKILVDIWLDPDFLALDGDAQWAYFMLLSQPKMSLVGAIDYQPNRWCQLRAGTSQADIERMLATLEAAGFVCIDHGTEELLVRSMTRHDGLRAGNPKLLKGMWGAWKSVASAALRKVAVDNMPDRLFVDEVTPPAAEHLRRSEPMDWAIEKAMHRPFGTVQERPIAPPSTIHRPTSANARSVAQTPPVDLEHHPVPRIPARTVHEAHDQLQQIRAQRFARGPLAAVSPLEDG